MYAGFNLELDHEYLMEDNYYYKKGKELYDLEIRDLETMIDNFVDEDGVLDASKLQEKWFPQSKANVFISHSHRDKRQAIALAGWLDENFGLTSFVDSCLWGYSECLLKLIDDRYCSIPRTTRYSYQSRNKSTSYVYMMLNMALASMIDNSESVFFLNTPFSISPKDVINNGDLGTTMSPWIYSEISMTKLVRHKEKSDHRSGSKGASSVIANESFNASFNIDLNHLVKLNKADLDEWFDKAQQNFHHYGANLDHLYEIKKHEMGK